MLIIHKNCDKSLAKDKTLPRNSYLVTYVQEEELSYDIVQSSSKVEIFDYYYDRYGNVLRDIRWTDGTVNPKCYQVKSKNKK
jgi:hypothetical protein